MNTIALIWRETDYLTGRKILTVTVIGPEFQIKTTTNDDEIIIQIEAYDDYYEYIHIQVSISLIDAFMYDSEICKFLTNTGFLFQHGRDVDLNLAEAIAKAIINGESSFNVDKWIEEQHETLKIKVRELLTNFQDCSIEDKSREDNKE